MPPYTPKPIRTLSPHSYANYSIYLRQSQENVRLFTGCIYSCIKAQKARYIVSHIVKIIKIQKCSFVNDVRPKKEIEFVSLGDRFC